MSTWPIPLHTLLCCIIYHLVWVISMSGRNLSIGAVDAKSSQQNFFHDHTFVAKDIVSRSMQTSILQNNATFSQTTSHPLETKTSVPTLACHDSTTYRNPLNPLLGCEHHRNTPCKEWKHLGLSSDDIDTLLFSCPVSCNMPCR